MAIGSTLTLLAAAVGGLGYLLSDPANVARVKPVLEPVLKVLPIGYHGHRVGDIFRHADLVDGPDFGTEGCEVIKGFDGCEDGEIHYGSHTAFFACTTINSRETFWPPQGLWNRTGFREQDYVIKYDLKTDVVTKLKVVGYDCDTCDIVTHGMGLWSEPGSDEIYIHLVNHKPHPQSCISIFKHTIGSEEMHFVEDNCDRLIVEPNDVTPTGPRSFFVTNMHAYNPHGYAGFDAVMRYIEDNFGSWEWTDVVYCGENEYFGKCRQVATGLVGGNGVLKVKDHLYVDNSGGGYINVYKINADHSLTLTETIELGSACDNLSYDPVADALLVATFPSIPAFFDHYHNPYKNKLAPIAIDRIKRLPDPAPGKTKHKASIVLFAKALTGGVSIAVADSEVRKTIIGGIKNEGLVVCRNRVFTEEQGKVDA
ncbi:hypothetical protein DFJ74DRAFT_652630 [Hyaloraphidium curvatum]|nr:hypothetical protein DFJ74DRAFT_652630 [Hyaloraphidium curvatum]